MVFSLPHALSSGSFVTAIAGIYVVILLRVYPRLFLRNYPREIRAVVPPLTRRERTTAILASIPLLAVVLGGPVWSAFDLAAHQGLTTTHMAIFWDAFFAGMTFNVFDLVVLDILWLGLRPPRFTQLEGTENIHPRLHLWPHLRGFLVASFAIAIVSVVATFMVPHV